MHEHAQSIPKATTRKNKAGGSATPTREPCPNCNQPVNAGNHFCSYCGSRLASLQPVVGDSGVSSSATEPALEIRQDPTGCAKTQVDQPLLPLVGPNAPAGSEAKREACDICGRVPAQDAQFCDQCGVRIGEMAPRYEFVGVSPGIEGLACGVAGEDLTIGKAPECCLPLLNDNYASRRHARVFRSQGMLFLEDLGSSNGTFLRVRRPIVLEAGDEIAVGTSVIRLVEADGRKPPTENPRCPV